ncbi:LacI family DNA-binding transcriptional regulator [Rariglobus hedericola]|uniref:LacI family transcriptional regulator n=1 Tax=Rariglobus hedericola TaxID=2597822 RepID=A0A556QKY5_9BACT|nr:LacI family DNA-binding transcriptional regulator [Rariglobus hedericola]TSJ77315.1 LacI family transcriptional regulator [Rariglobus hedericola]
MKRISMQDIADAAGVSRMAVSYALRNNPKVPATTREHIKKIAESLGYRPDPLIQRLSVHLANARRSPHAGCIGYITTDHTKSAWQGIPAYRTAFNAVVERAEQLGYRTEEFWLGELGMTAAKLSRILTHRGVAGIVMAPVPGGMKPPRLKWADFASVALGYSMRAPAVHRVVNHQLHTGLEAIRQLQSLGYHRIGLCVSRDQNDRVDNAWLHTMLFHHSCVASLRRVAPYMPDELTREGILRWVADESPDCLLVQDQFVRVYLTEAGYRVPVDLGVVMLDHNAANEPDFAGMKQRHDKIGAACVDLLVAQIHRNEKGLPAAPLTVMIDGEWVSGATVKMRGSKTV